MGDPARDVVASGPSPAATTALDIHIDGAKAADAPAIAAMGAKTFAESFGYSVSSDDLALYLQETFTAPAVSRELADVNITTLVARMSEPSEGGVEGSCAGGKRGDWDWTVDDVLGRARK